MAKLYWLVWAREDDFNKAPGLPGGFTSVKDARLCAIANAKKDHPIIVEDDTCIMKFGKYGYAQKYAQFDGKTVPVRIPILNDGSISKKKPTKKDIISKADMAWEKY